MSSTSACDDRDGDQSTRHPSLQPPQNQQPQQQHAPLHVSLPLSQHNPVGGHGYHGSFPYQHQAPAGSSLPHGLQHHGYTHFQPQPQYPYPQPMVGVSLNAGHFQQLPPWPQYGYSSAPLPPLAKNPGHPSAIFNSQPSAVNVSIQQSQTQPPSHTQLPSQQRSMPPPSPRNPPPTYSGAGASDSDSSSTVSAAKSKSSTPLNQNQIHAQTHPWRIKVYNACLACRKKKIKCDGQPTCNRCERLGYECSYVEVPQTPKDKNKSKTTTSQSSLSRTIPQPAEPRSESAAARVSAASPMHIHSEPHPAASSPVPIQLKDKQRSSPKYSPQSSSIRDPPTQYASHSAFRQPGEPEASGYTHHMHQTNEYGTSGTGRFQSSNSLIRSMQPQTVPAFVLEHDTNLPDLFHILSKAVASPSVRHRNPGLGHMPTAKPRIPASTSMQIGMDNSNIVLVSPVIPTITVLTSGSTDTLHHSSVRSTQSPPHPWWPTEDSVLASSASQPGATQRPWLTSSPQSVGLLVTNKSIIQYLIHVYFECFHPTWMIVDKKLFLSQLKDSSNPPDPLLLVAMCAAAAKYADHEELCTEAGKMATVGDQFLSHARILLQERFDVPSLATVQALLILYWCQIHSGKGSLRFMYIGMAIRMAQALGFNRPLDTQQQREIGEREVQIRKTIWWSCYQADRWTSAALGKPMVISDADCIIDYPTSIHSDETAWEQHFRYMTDLARILGKIILNLYSSTTATTCSSAVFSQLDQSLSNWYESLPSSLQYAVPGDQSSSGHMACSLNHNPSKNITPSIGPLGMQEDQRLESPVLSRPFSATNIRGSTSVSMSFGLDSPSHYTLLFHTARILLYRPFLHNTNLAPILPLTLSSPQNRCRDSAIIISSIAESLVKSSQVCQQMFSSIHIALCAAATIHRFVITSPKGDLSPNLMDGNTVDSNHSSKSSADASSTFKEDLQYLVVNLRIIQHFCRFAIEPSTLRLLLDGFLPLSHLNDQERSLARAGIQQPIRSLPFSIKIPFPTSRGSRPDAQQDDHGSPTRSLPSSPSVSQQQQSTLVAAGLSPPLSPSVIDAMTTPKQRGISNKPDLRLALPATYFTAQQRDALRQQDNPSQVLPQNLIYSQEGQGGQASRSRTPTAFPTLGMFAPKELARLGDKRQFPERHQQYQLRMLYHQQQQMLKHQQQQQPAQSQPALSLRSFQEPRPSSLLLEGASSTSSSVVLPLSHSSLSPTELTSQGGQNTGTVTSSSLPSLPLSGVSQGPWGGNAFSLPSFDTGFTSSFLEQQQRQQNHQDLELLRQQHRIQQAQLDQRHQQQSMLLEQSQRDQHQQHTEVRQALVRQQQQIALEQQQLGQQSQLQHEQHYPLSELSPTSSNRTRSNRSTSGGGVLNCKQPVGNSLRSDGRRIGQPQQQQQQQQWQQKKHSLPLQQLKQSALASQSSQSSEPHQYQYQRQRQSQNQNQNQGQSQSQSQSRQQHQHQQRFMQYEQFNPPSTQVQPHSLTSQTQTSTGDFNLDDTFPIVLLSPSATAITLATAIDDVNRSPVSNVGFLSQFSEGTENASPSIEGNSNLDELLRLGALDYYSTITDASQSTQASSVAGRESLGGGSVDTGAGHSNPSTRAYSSGTAESPELMSGSTNQFWYPGVGVGVSPTKLHPSGPLFQPQTVAQQVNPHSGGNTGSNRSRGNITPPANTQHQQQQRQHDATVLLGFDALAAQGPQSLATLQPSQLLPASHQPMSQSQVHAVGNATAPYGYPLNYTYPYLSQHMLPSIGHIPPFASARALRAYQPPGHLQVFADPHTLPGGLYHMHAPPMGHDPMSIHWQQHQQQYMAQQLAQLQQQQQQQQSDLKSHQLHQQPNQQQQQQRHGSPSVSSQPSIVKGVADGDSGSVQRPPLQQTLAELQQTLEQPLGVDAPKGTSSNSLPPLPQGSYRDVRSYSSASSHPASSHNTGSSGGSHSTPTPSHQESGSSMTSVSDRSGSRSKSVSSTDQSSSSGDNNSSQRSASASVMSAQYDSSQSSNSSGEEGSGSSFADSHVTNMASSSSDKDGERGSGSSDSQAGTGGRPSGRRSGRSTQKATISGSSLAFGKQQWQSSSQQQQSPIFKSRSRRSTPDSSGDSSSNNCHSDEGTTRGSTSGRLSRDSNKDEHSSGPTDQGPSAMDTPSMSDTLITTITSSEGSSSGMSLSPSAQPKPAPSSGSNSENSSASSGGDNGNSSGSGSENKSRGSGSARSDSIGSGSSGHSSSDVGSQDSSRAMSVDQPVMVGLNKKGRSKGGNKRRKNKKVQPQPQPQPQQQQRQQQQSNSQLQPQQKQQQQQTAIPALLQPQYHHHLQERKHARPASQTSDRQSSRYRKSAPGSQLAVLSPSSPPPRSTA